MSAPSMEELRGQYAQEPIRYAKELFDLEVAFYHGHMAALDAVAQGKINGDHYGHGLNAIVEELRDKANAEMAAEIGG